MRCGGVFVQRWFGSVLGAVRAFPAQSVVPFRTVGHWPLDFFGYDVHDGYNVTKRR